MALDVSYLTAAGAGALSFFLLASCRWFRPISAIWLA